MIFTVANESHCLDTTLKHNISHFLVGSVACFSYWFKRRTQWTLSRALQLWCFLL